MIVLMKQITSIQASTESSHKLLTTENLANLRLQQLVEVRKQLVRL